MSIPPKANERAGCDPVGECWLRMLGFQPPTQQTQTPSLIPRLAAANQRLVCFCLHRAEFSSSSQSVCPSVFIPGTESTVQKVHAASLPFPSYGQPVARLQSLPLLLSSCLHPLLRGALSSLPPTHSPKCCWR